jgi:uridine kinase
MPRQEMLHQIARRIADIDRPHAVRVGIDGPGAAGKTTLADELATLLAPTRPVLRVGIDGFHHPRSHRTRRGPDSVEGYYHDSFDHDAVCKNVLAPLGPDGDGIFRPAVFDFRVDSTIDHPWQQAPANAVLLFEGMFLFRPELNDHWDFRIFVHADFHVTLQRAACRDLELFGSDEEVRRRYHTRYIPGQTHYIETVRPRAMADIVVNNNDPHRPAMKWAPFYESDA